jgi:hypothetical protein
MQHRKKGPDYFISSNTTWSRKIETRHKKCPSMQYSQVPKTCMCNKNTYSVSNIYEIFTGPALSNLQILVLSFRVFVLLVCLIHAFWSELKIFPPYYKLRPVCTLHTMVAKVWVDSQLIVVVVVSVASV